MFRKSLLGLVFSFSMASAAFAFEINFFNTAHQEIKVNFTFPNGSTKSQTLSAGSDSSGSSKMLLAPGVKSLKVQVTDKQGNEIWSGDARRLEDFLIFQEGSSTRVVPCGFASGGKDNPHGALFMNSTGEDLTVDLEGGNGIAAHRGIKAPAVFDPRALVKMDSRESSYTVKLKSASGSDLTVYSGNKVYPGHYYQVRKDARGNYRVEGLGAITPTKEQ